MISGGQFEEGSEDIACTSVFFGHGRPYAQGYVLEIHDYINRQVYQYAVPWADLPTDDARWTPHDLVEYFMDNTLPEIRRIIGDRDLVLYFDCLKVSCDHPHVLTRRMLEKAGAL